MRKLVAVVAGLSACCALGAAPLTLETPTCAVRFADAASGYAVTGIVNRLSGGVSFIRPQAGCCGFWRLNFQRVTKAGKRETFVLTNVSAARQHAVREMPNARTFVWSGLSLPDSEGAVEVTATVAVDAADDAMTHWRIAVQNTSADWALFSTDYPVLSSPLKDNEGKILMPAGNLGAQYVSKAPPSRHPYFHSRPMVAAFDVKGGGLYVAARDGEARIKETVFEKGNTLTFRTVVENAGVVGKAAASPGYPVTLAVYRGDWWQAAKIHRRWALKQYWAKRSVQRIDSVPHWLNIHGGPQATLDALTKAKKCLPDFATGIHWHLWQHSPHDVNYPEYFPAQPGTAEAIAKLREIGQVPMLYINGRRWSSGTQGFTFAKPYAVKEVDGRVHESLFPPAPPLASMCPTRPEWHGIVSNLVTRMLNELHAPAIFIDEVGNEPCVPCFDPMHGHPLGGGRWWADGCRATLAPCAKLCHAQGAYLTTEGSTEALMDLVDGFLVVASRSPDDVPWYTAVYSGYATYFCSPSHVNDTPESFWMLQAREVLNGIVPGWYYPEVLDDARKVAMIRALCAFRREHENYFKEGELLDAFRPAGTLETVDGFWQGRGTAPKQAAARGKSVKMPVVIGTVWQAPEKGARKLFLANVSNRRQSVRAQNDGFTDEEYVLEPYSVRAFSEKMPSVQQSRVKWICPNESFVQGVQKERFYRHTFNVKAGLTNAVARWWFDDRGAFWLDGTCVTKSNQCIEKPRDVTALLQRAGRHTVAVQDCNLAGVGGICLSILLTYDDGTQESVYTSDAWRVSATECAGWQVPTFDDAAWPKARVYDDLHAAPWCALKDMTLLMPPDERAFEQRRLVLRAEQKKTLLTRLANEPKPVCRVRYDRGKPYFDIGGKRCEAMFYNTSESYSDANPKLARQTGYFRDAGMHLFGVGCQVKDIWRADGSIDFAAAVKPIDDVLANDPLAFVFYSINTVLPPAWWVNAHPQECVGYARATVDRKQGACLKNCAAGSAASQVWRRDWCDFQRRLVTYLESTPYAARIFAYRTDWGINHEWHYYGMRGLMPDCGAAMTRAFRDWLRDHYRNDVGAFRAAWHDASVTFETAEVPSPAARLHKGAAPWRDPITDRAVIDYERCHAAQLRDLCLAAAKTIKEACGGRALVGTYGGYYFGIDETAEGCHLENDAVLDSPYIDFQCSPQQYSKESRQPGGAQYARCLLEGLRSRGKLSIQEADNAPSHVDTTYNRWAKDAEGDIALLARDFVQTLCWGCGYWYFDFGQGWYAEPHFKDFFKKIAAIRAADADCTSVSEVVVIGDYESTMFSNVDWPPSDEMHFISRQTIALGKTGVPFDSASWRDIARGKLGHYKVAIFLNLRYVTPEKLAFIAKLRAAGTHLVWLGVPGTLSASGVDPKGIARPDEKVFRRPATAEELNALFAACGVHRYCADSDAAVYACASYVALHNAHAGRKTIRLPKPMTVTQVYPETHAIGTNVVSFDFDARGPATTLFRLTGSQR